MSEDTRLETFLARCGAYDELPVPLPMDVAGMEIGQVADALERLHSRLTTLHAELGDEPEDYEAKMNGELAYTLRDAFWEATAPDEAIADYVEYLRHVAGRTEKTLETEAYRRRVLQETTKAVVADLEEDYRSVAGKP